VLGLWAFYLVGVNLFLNLNGLSLAFKGTNQVSAKMQSGWSVFPGRVHVQALRVTFQDHNLQFSIDVAHAFVVVHVSELVHHTFHASHLRGDGVAFHLRHRIDPWSQHEPAVGAFAPMPEFRSPAVFEAYVPEPPIPDAEYNLWTVHLDDVDVGVSEAWVQAFRYRGHGRAKGQFQLVPARNLWVGPASLDLEPGLLSAGTYRITPDLRAHIDCTVHPFDVRPYNGMEVFRFISAHVALKATAVDPAVAALFAPRSVARIASSGGDLELTVGLDHGVFTPLSRVEVSQRALQLDTPDVQMRADSVKAIASMEGNTGSEVLFIVDQANVKEGAALGYPPRIEHFAAALLSDNRDTTKDFPFSGIRLDEAQLKLVDAEWLNHWFHAQALLSGAATVQARGSYRDRHIDGEALVETENLGASRGAERVRYAGALALRIVHADPENWAGSATADLDGRSLHAELADGTFNVAGFKVLASAEGDGYRQTVTADAKVSSFSGHVGDFTVNAPAMLANAVVTNAGGLRSTRFIASIPSLSAKSRTVRLTSAVQARGVLVENQKNQSRQVDLVATLVEPRATVGLEHPERALTKRVEVHAALASNAAGALSGEVHLLPASWQVERENLRLAGKSSLDLSLAKLDFGKHRGAAKGHLSAQAVSLGDTTQDADCPWSRIEGAELDGSAKLLERGSAELALSGLLAQTELSWGDFTTHGDVAIDARFEPGLLDDDGRGALQVNLRKAALRSATGAAQGWAAQVPDLQINAELSRAKGKLAGNLRLAANQARGRIGATQLATDLGGEFVLDTLDFGSRTAHGTGKVRIRNASVLNSPEPVKGWWADVSLDSLHGRVTQNLELGGMFHANLRDATPGLAVLASEGSLPKWIPSLFPLRGLAVTGSLARRCRLTDITLVNLSGGPAVARGRLQSLPDGFQGALLVRLAGFSAVSAGLQFDAQNTHVGLFDGDAWLAGLQQGFDRKSKNASEMSCPVDPGRCGEDEQDPRASVK